MMQPSLIKQVLLFIFLLFFSTELFALSEREIKAVFLEKFTHLIQWPQDNSSDFVICVMNDDKFAKTIEKVYKNKTFNSKHVNIINLSEKDKIPSCQLLFIGKGTKNVTYITQRYAKEPVLTVSDHIDLLADNIMITIFLDKKRFNYIINNKAAKDANISISYLLLKSAQKVIK